MASGNIIAFNGANIIQTAQGVPSGAVQASGAIPNPQYGAQPLGMSTSAPQQVPQKGRLEKFLNSEIKVLGAIQIMIGLIHIGFGAVLLCLISSYYLTTSGRVGYPIWGGIFFIVSGSLCVAAAKRPNRGLVQSSVGMNITSAIMALIGIILYSFEMILNNLRYKNQYNTGDLTFIEHNIGYGLSSLLLLFSVLEFCITVSLAHFGCQATCCSDDQPTMLYWPYQVIRGGAVTHEPNPPPPPTYNNMVTQSQ